MLRLEKYIKYIQYFINIHIQLFVTYKFFMSGF